MDIDLRVSPAVEKRHRHYDAAMGTYPPLFWGAWGRVHQRSLNLNRVSVLCVTMPEAPHVVEPWGLVRVWLSMLTRRLSLARLLGTCARSSPVVCGGHPLFCQSSLYDTVDGTAKPRLYLRFVGATAP